MTTVAQIITDAYRESNLIAIGTSATANEEAEALRLLDRAVKSVFGYEAGENLVPFPLGRNNVTEPSGFPAYDNVPGGDWYAPTNARFILNVTQAISIPLNIQPDDGSRVGVIDASDNLDTYNVTLQGNGRTIEGVSSLVLDTAGLNREWFYRADLGEWKQLTDLTLASEFPFPEEFDDMFVIMLAMRLNPRNDMKADPQSFNAYRRVRQIFRARYKQITEVASEEALLRMSEQVYTETSYDNRFDNTNKFKRGYPW